MKKRIVSLTMVLALCLMLLPTSAFAAEDSGAAIGTGGLCAHHTEHDDTCGYVEGSAESPCIHEHSEDCYTEVTSCTHEHTRECYPASDSSIPEDGTTSSEDESVLPEAAEPSLCSHVCSEESGCIKQELDCKHEHDDECGYAPATEGQPCTYVCTLCGMTEITAWSFVDTEEVLDPDSGVLVLSASADSPVPYEDIVALLPAEIEATTEGGTETLSLDSWSCDDYPEEGAYTGSYAFHAVLPEGYGLAVDAPALTVTVELDDEVMLMAEGQHSHCICGANHRDIGEHKVEASVSFDKKLSSNLGGNGWLEIDDITAAKETSGGQTYYVLPAGSYYLDGDVSLNGSILIKDGAVNICLNGHNLYLNHGSVQIWEVIRLNGGTLNLTDCKGKGTVCHVDGNPGRGVTVENGTSFTLYGGTICNNEAYASNSTTAQGGGVYIGSSSTFNMYGGKIHNNWATVGSNGTESNRWGYGGGVYCAPNGTFNLLAGEITENQVRVDSNNGGAGMGGGVFNKGTFTMSGDSKISKNFIASSSSMKQYGGGVCNCDSAAKFVMNGGEISGNYINSWYSSPACGGGVYNNSKFEFTGGTITGNRLEAASVNVFGGGVYNDQSGNFTMSSGIISNNTTKTNGASGGGGVCIYRSTFTMNSGEISGNQALTYTASASPNACDGGGIYFDSGTIGNFTLSGGTITGNTTKGKGAGICIYDDSDNSQKHFHLSGNPVVWDNKTDNKQCNLYMYYRYDLKSPLTPGAKVGLSFGWIGEGGAYLALNTPIKQGASYEWFFKPADSNNYQCSSGKLVLWAGTSGGSSSNPSDGNSSNTSGGGSNTGGSSSDDGNTSDIGNSNNGSSNANIPPTPVTVPVSGDEKTIQVDAVVSGNTATIKNVDLSKLDTVIEDTAKNGVVTIDFSVLKKVDNVKLPSNVVKQIAEAVNEPDNDAKDLEIVLANGTSIKLDAKMLGEKNVKANGTDITISIKRITGSSLNIKQKQAVGSRPALDINVTIGGKPISDMNGKVTVSAAYELKPGEHASGIVVSYVDANGNRQLCETSYDPIRKQVSWKTGSFSPSSVYMIGYDESRVHAYVTYTVQKGSTLSMIAKKHGCTVADIMAANSGLIKNPNRIFVGWQLKIPQD